MSASTLPARREKRHVVVFGHVMTKYEALQKALDLSERADHTAAARVLDAAGLWPHDLIEAHRLERQSPAAGSNASRDKIRGLNTTRSSTGV